MLVPITELGKNGVQHMLVVEESLILPSMFFLLFHQIFIASLLDSGEEQNWKKKKKVIFMEILF